MTDVMTIPFTRTMLLLSYIKGPNVHKWVAAQINWLSEHLNLGAQVTDEHLWDTIIQRF
jgi:hypothetical protein